MKPEATARGTSSTKRTPTQALEIEIDPKGTITRVCARAGVVA